MEIRNRKGELLFAHDGTLAETLESAKNKHIDLNEMMLSGDIKDVTIVSEGIIYLKNCNIQNCSINAFKVFVSDSQLYKVNVIADKLSIFYSHSQRIEADCKYIVLYESVSKVFEIKSNKCKMDIIDSTIINTITDNCHVVLDIQGATFDNLKIFNARISGSIINCHIRNSILTYVDLWQLETNSMVLDRSYCENLIVRHSDIDLTVIKSLISGEKGRSNKFNIESVSSEIKVNEVSKVRI